LNQLPSRPRKVSSKTTKTKKLRLTTGRYQTGVVVCLDAEITLGQ